MRKLLALAVILALGAALPGCCSSCGVTVSSEEDPGVAPPSHACAGCWRPADTGPAPESILGCCRPPADTGPAPQVCVQKPCLLCPNAQPAPEVYVQKPCPLFRAPAESCCHPACWPL